MKNENPGGSRKAPRKHQAHWKDNTINKRQNKRRELLNWVAKESGYASWSAYETAVLRGETRLTQRAPDGASTSAKEEASRNEALGKLLRGLASPRR